MEFGSLRNKSRNQTTQQQKSRCRAFSTSNLSSVSCNSAILGRRSLCVTLPRDFGCDVGVDGRILRVIKGKPAHASGVVQVGDYVRIFDRILNKDDSSLKSKSNCNSSTKTTRTDNITLHVTYGVLQVDSRPSCPLIIEIGNRSNTSLGIALADSAENKIRISSVQPGSLADRCGFLRQGDILTSVHISSQETVPCSPYYTSYQIAQILRKLATQGSSITLTIFPHEESSNSSHHASQTSETSDSGSTLTLMEHEQRTYFNTIDRRNRRDKERLEHNHEEEDGDRCVLTLCLWKDRLYEDWGFSLVDQNENGDDTETEGEENSAKATDFLLKLRKMKNRGVRGSFVYETRRGGPAFMAGLKPGDRILQINDRDVSHLESTILVPILASLDDALNLVISRPQNHVTE